MSWRWIPLVLAACGPQVPEDWDDATEVADLTQSGCDGSPYDTGWEEAMTAEADGDGLRVVGEPLHFRCDQDVTAFWRRAGEAVDVLVQPVDMNPGSVARCDCLYRVELGIPEAPPADVTLYRRWDNLNSDNDPVEVGSARVE